MLHLIAKPGKKKKPLKKIKINPKNKGKFKKYCGGKVDCACIEKALKSKDPEIRKRANFVYNFSFVRNGNKCKAIENMRKKNKRKKR